MKKIAIITIIAIVFIRFFSFNIIPPGLSNDETEYVMSAKTYSLHKTDVSGYGLPLSLFKTETDGIISPIPPILLSIPLKFITLNTKNIRLIYILINLTTTLCLFHLVKLIFPTKKQLPFIASALFLLNPWSTYLSRVAVDTPFALLFYLLGMYLLLKFDNWKLITAFIFFLLAFFSYHGGKIIFIPVILITLLYKNLLGQNGESKSKNSIYFLTFSFAFIFLFTLISWRIPGSILNARSQDIFFKDTKKISSIVNEYRRESLKNAFNNLFLNKPVIIFQTFAKQYLSAFSPDVLFISGDYRATYRFGVHGLFYLIDIVFLVFGITGMYSKNKREFFLFGSLIAISPIATGISNVEISVINRSFLLLPLLVIFISYGVLELINLSKNPSLNKTTSFLIVIALTFSSANFYHFYFFRFPILAQENYWLGERILYKYLTWVNKSHTVRFITERPRSSYLRYLFYNNNSSYNKYLSKPIPYVSEGQIYKIENISFTDTCPESYDKDTIYAIQTRLNCNVPFKPTFTIIDQKDAGVIINIYNSDICQGISKDVYRRFHYLKYYDLENLSYEDFCSNWINIPL